jgi:hypothetical protein
VAAAARGRGSAPARALDLLSRGAEHIRDVPAGERLAIGWTVAAPASAPGMLASVWPSAPPGASVVCTFGALLVVAALVRPLVPGRA